MSSYNIVMLIVTVAASYILAVIMMGLLAQRFFSWFKSNRNSVVLFYGLASTMLAINAGFTFVLVDIILLDRPTEVIPHVGTAFTTFIPGSATAMLNYAYIISSIISFMLTWVATALLLRHYSQKLGRIKYWIIISIPLVYFLSQFLTLFLNLFEPLLQSNPIFYSIVFTLVFTLSKPAGGILFGIAFWTIARSLSQSTAVRNYMTISAYGFVLLFISNQGIVISAAPYPPFGLATIAFMGLSSYLILVGVYSSAISVAQDSKLRQSIRKFAIKESKLLDSIGSSQMEQEIQRKVIIMTKEHRDRMMEETGVQSSLNKEDVNQYLEEVLKEIQKKK
jgi:hypothetical protein